MRSAKEKLQKLLTQKPLKWTEHAHFKMRQYGLSEARVKRVLRTPTRVEAGIAPKTVAVMQPASSSTGHTSAALRLSGTGKPSGRPAAPHGQTITITRKWTQEIWVMYADTKKERRIIAAWRYPGVSPVREPPPFPDDILE